MKTDKVLRIVENTICEHRLAEEKAHIILGLSGGPDSVCLFDVLMKLSKTYGYVLHVVHVNHQIRGKEARADQEYVESMCDEAGVDCHIISFDCARRAEELGVSEEEAGRSVRYEAFAKDAREIAEELGDRSNVKIAVAHNFNDQAETVLMRIIRGTGIAGLKGMEYSRMDDSGFEIIRPLLDVKREDIEEYCRQQSLYPRIDRTNLETIYNRNKIRLELIPQIDFMFNSDITESLVRLSSIAAEDDEFIETVASEVYESAKSLSDGRVTLKLKAVRDCAKPVQKRIILRAMKDSGLSQDMTGAHVDAAVELIAKAIVSSRLNFPHGFGIRIGYEDIEIGRLEDHDEKEAVSFDSFKLVIGDDESLNVVANAVFDYDKMREAFGDDFESKLELRTRREGDFICISASGNTKKLKKYYIDEKVPAAIRDVVPIVAIGSEVVFIAGSLCWIKNRYSDRCKADENTRKTSIISIVNS